MPPTSGVTTSKTIALIGNPNTGKTTLFNILTGMSQQVGNFPGVTVERKSGRMALNDGHSIELLDLPGTYSLAAYSPDELIAVDVLLGQQPGIPPVDALLVIVDASNLRRNLYLVSQLIETGLPLLIALNMMDVATAHHIQIDSEALTAHLGAPVIPVCAHRRQGLPELRHAMAELVAGHTPAPRTRPQFPEFVQQQVAALTAWTPPSTNHHRQLSELESFRALIDEKGHTEQRLTIALGDPFAAALAEMRGHIRKQLGELPLSALESTTRYAWIDTIINGCVHQPTHLRDSRSDRVDRLLTHRVLGLVIFIAVNALIFQAIYAWAGPLMDGIEQLFGALGSGVEGLMPPGALRSLLVDGIIAGVGAVIIFLPQIAILFLFISLLEDCGYIARAALLMDRLLTLCGLSGKSFIPLLSSFACAVPGIMATRTIEDRRDRITTIMVAPLMSCSARLPIYILLIAAFVPDRPLIGTWFNLQGFTLLAMYTLGIAFAVPIAYLLKKLLLRGDIPPFLMELPSFKWPDPRTVLMRVYQNSRAFIVRAGSVILAATVVMWALAYFPRAPEKLQEHEQQRRQLIEEVQESAAREALRELENRQAAELLEASFLGRAGRLIEPLVRPLGWDWRIGMATLASFPAREVVISALSTIYTLGGDVDEDSADLRTTLRNAFTLPVALSIMVFFALCAQCTATLITIQRETGAWRWAIFAFGYMSALAYAGAFTVYRLATTLGWGG